MRQLRGPTTIEQRRAAYDRFMAMKGRRQPKPVTVQEQVRRYQPVGLAILFGVMGWTLAGLGRVTFVRAAGWWLLVYAAMLTFGGMPGTITGMAMPILPHAYSIPIFGAITLALVVASWHRHPAP